MSKYSKSQKKLSQAENGQIVDHARYIKTYRYQVTRVLRDIEAGTVNVEDLEKLRNFCQMSISLMETAPIHQIQSAWRHTEIVAFAHNEVEDADTPDYGVVMAETPTQFKDGGIVRGIVYPTIKGTT